MGFFQSDNAYALSLKLQQISPPDSVATDSTEVPKKYEPSFRPTYEQRDRFGDPFSNTQSPSPLLLQDPSNLTIDVEIDTGMNYTIYERIGALNYRPRTTMTYQQFSQFQEDRMKKEYWKQRSAGLDGESAVSSRRLIPKIYISPVFDRLFGGNYVDIQPNGFVNMDFGGRWQKVENPAIPINQRRNGGFNYEQQMSLNIVGNVGEKLSITANYDNNNTFDFQNNLKIEYNGYEEDIIKKIEIGNVSMPVANSLISGGESLFGVKTQLQFGKLYVTALASRQQGTFKQQSFGGNKGDLEDQTEIQITRYDEYKHFFLGHFFRDNYEEWLSRLPQVTSSLLIQNIQVYVVRNAATNDAQNRRSIVALTDLGETDKTGNTTVVPPSTSAATDNDANGLYDRVRNLIGIRDVDQAGTQLRGIGLQDNLDYSVRNNVRKLDLTEYTIQEQLGYITLRSPLNEGEILAVAFEYSYNGQRYQVGELPTSNSAASSDEPLILKMLKPQQQNLDRPVWDLAMKNIYTLPQARNLSEGDIKIQILYEDNTINYKAPFLNEGINTNNIPLMRVLKLDQLNKNNDNQPDSYFDFISKITFDQENGSLIFPVLEPFGSTLEAAFASNEQDLVDKYVFNELYDQTQITASQNSTKNKFLIVAEYEGANQSEFLLEGFNILEGSVVVTSGSQVLVEGQDYRVDYLGIPKVTILNQGIVNSGNAINISYEEADVFGFSSRWLTGARFDYQFTDKINMGATVMHLNERTQGISRFSIGNEPVKNTKYGFDLNFEDESRFLTKAVDALPLISTKEPSMVSFNGEFAQLISGTSNQVKGESTSYIDDFESTATTYQLGGGHLGWKLGSTPLGEGNLPFDRRVENTEDAILGVNYKRAKMAWYSIDRSVYTSGPGRPSGIDDADLRNPYVKPIFPQDLFRVDLQAINVNLSTFDIAFYPNERGPYNYNNNPEDYNSDGTFVNPRESFGSITRKVPADFDFNRANIEYIEFWMLDPFIQEGEIDGAPVSPIYDDLEGGELVFNLGEVFEDVLKDERHAFENGLPSEQGNTIDGVDAVELNDWGRVTTQNFFTPFFDATGDARENQDIGLDGLPSDEYFIDGQNFSEASYFSDHMSPLFSSGALDVSAESEFLSDLSEDDFRFYLDESYGDNTPLLERYKDFNGLENNSQSNSSNSSVGSSATNIPDNEDLNEDNIVTQGETESYFEYKLRLNRNSLNTNHPFVVDVTSDQQQANWYLFRIPIQQPTDVVGAPSYNSIRFMRTYMTGWAEPVVIRMANFRFVASQWRKFTGDLADDGFSTIPEPIEADFDISMVNVEQNSTPAGDKPPYTLPPGIERDLDNTTTVTRRNNEQSLRICVNDLKDGDARAAFKTPVDIDLVNYGRMKMFFHAESVGDEILDDGAVNAFLRLGRDDSENYYEIELPLIVTPDGIGAGNDDATRRLVWPEENEIDIAIEELYNLKSQRNQERFDVTRTYSQPSSNNRYTLSVKGNPKFSDLQLLMIGVRNPADETRRDESVCIWANELRVTDFNDQNGWAANARLNVQLADFATISASTKYVSSGFGGIQDRIAERTREETQQYDVSANVNVDKLIPWKTGIKIPMFVSTSKTIQTPQFDPLDSDLPLKVALREFETKAEREDYKNKVITREDSKSINFMNVHKEKVKEDAKKHIYDIENFSFSYSYSENKRSDQTTAELLQKNYFGSVTYTFDPALPPIEPFKQIEAFSSPYLQLIKDINFSPIPQNFSARASIDRSFLRTQFRNADLTTDGLDPIYEKLFYFDRTYTLRWNIFQNLSLNYNATTNAIIDEPDGDIDTGAKRREIWDNITSLGRTKNFNQNLSANYRLPLDKFPLTEWISADYRYAVDYGWLGTNRDQIKEFGNEIQNSRTQDVNARLDFVGLYNKIDFLKKINTPPRRSRRRPTEEDTTRQMNPLAKGFLRLLMSVRSVNATFSRRENTNLPGFLPNPYMFGLDSAFSAPGWRFVLGSQDPSIRFRASDNQWLVANADQSAPFIQSLTREFNIKTNIEPFRDFRIQVDMRRSSSSNYQEIYRYNPSIDPNPDDEDFPFSSLTPTRGGSYSITYMPIATAFETGDGPNNSRVFDEFISNRTIIQSRLNQRVNGEYGLNSQDVLIPAFLAAYTGQQASTIRPNPVPKIPMPNWRLDYAGLSRLQALENIFSTVNITHAYTSSFNIASYTSSSLYGLDDPAEIDLTNDILDYPLASKFENEAESNLLTPVYTINQVNISERFSPFLGVNIRTKNNLSLQVEYSRSRDLTLELSSGIGQITDQKSSDWTFDVGYAQDQLKLPFRIQGRTVVIKNEVQMRMSFTIRDTRTIQRIIDERDVLSQGNINYQIRPTLSYMANNRLNITMYFDKAINRPKITSNFPRTTSAFGVQVRFNLAN